jgi:hypothetical protein
LNLNLRTRSKRAWRIHNDDISRRETACHLNGIGRLYADDHIAALDLVVRNDVGLRLRRIGPIAKQS